MRMIVVSDTHGNRKALREAVSRQGPFDGLIHLGDGVEDGITVAGEFGLPFHGVRGNEDYGSRLPDRVCITFGPWSFLLMHGYQMDISAYHSPRMWDGHLAEMAAWAREDGAHAFLFGHTHAPLLKKVRDILICNPGDQYIGSTIPRSYASVELSDDEMRVDILRREPRGDWTSFLSHTEPR